METLFDTMKGIPPGPFLGWKLKKLDISRESFALSIGTDLTTLDHIIASENRIDPDLALRIEKELSLDSGLLDAFHSYHTQERERKRMQRKPNLQIFRRSLFWDTTIDKIDWKKHQRAIIERVFERGDEEEKKEIERFYGPETVKAVLANHKSWLLFAADSQIAQIKDQNK